jgi:hypothetical protein
MYSSKLNIYKEIYGAFLPLFLTMSTTIGITSGIFTLDEKIKPIDHFSNIIGYTGLGIITGFTYPISYPFFGFYILYKNIKNIKNIK